MFDGLGGHIGAAEGAITIGDDFDINGAAIGILRESFKGRAESCRPLLVSASPPPPLLSLPPFLSPGEDKAGAGGHSAGLAPVHLRVLVS